LIKFRENDYPPISRKQLQETNDILDRIRTMVEKLNTKEEWKERTLDAITYSKTSLMNIHLASPENPEPEEDAEPTGAA
jgi:Mg2+ and Co2+ transporter CorA